MVGQHFAHDFLGAEKCSVFPAGQAVILDFNFVKSCIILNESNRIFESHCGFNEAILLFNSSLYFAFISESQKRVIFLDNFCPSDVLHNN